MAHFVIVKGEVFGVKSYPLAFVQTEQVEAGNLAVAVSKAAKLLASKAPKGKKLSRMTLYVSRVE